MQCNHKFQNYLDLRLIDFKPHTLIVGTFNPNLDENKADWFYGRKNNYFWDVLPRLYNEKSLRHSTSTEWKEFCRTHKIAITDLIMGIGITDNDNNQIIKKLGNYKDDEIVKNFNRNKIKITNINIVQLLQQHKSIKEVYFTRSLNDSYWNNLWSPVDEYCLLSNIKCKTLLTPSGNARFQMGGYKGTLSDYIFMKWQEQWL